MDAPTLVPVHVLTGGLGSGKTTLLNAALRAGLGVGTAIVVNEFGAIALDQLFVQARSEDTMVLKGGCVCCTLRSDLVATLMHVLTLRPATASFERILIETSGLADAVPILRTLRSDPRLSVRFRIGAVACTIDVIDGPPGRRSREASNQITAADVVVITKRDLASTEFVAIVEEQISALNPLAESIPATGSALNEWLRAWERQKQHPPAAYRLGERADMPSAAERVRSVVISTDASLSWPRFAVWLTLLLFVHGERILRLKGILFDADRDTWIAVHCVRRFLYPPAHLDLVDPPPFGACLVFITEDLDTGRIERSFERMVVKRVAGSDAPPRH
jgi:G3E family GTPase